jgi:hypothetical protein
LGREVDGGVGLIEVDGALDQAKSQYAGVEIEIVLRTAGDRRNINMVKPANAVVVGYASAETPCLTSGRRTPEQFRTCTRLASMKSGESVGLNIAILFWTLLTREAVPPLDIAEQPS